MYFHIYLSTLSLWWMLFLYLMLTLGNLLIKESYVPSFHNFLQCLNSNSITS